MRRCRKCNAEWPDSMSVCPNDGWAFSAEMDATQAPRETAGTAAVAVALPEPELPSQDLEPGTQVGEYRIERKIGEGGMGAVYAAVHPLIGKKAAIKVISAALGTEPSAVQRFIQEARSVNQIGHPNIVDVFAFGTLPDGRNYFVMEHLQGEGLANRLHRGAMPLGEAIEILDQVADALEAAHEKQIVHRDLKPDNVFLASVRGGRMMVKLLDFGIAKLSVAEASSGGGGIAKTRTGMMMGTPGYLSPEQARGKNVDHRTDIYALGCMTFEIACGRLPFVADNAMDIVLAHMTEPPPHPSSVWPEIPLPLDELIVRMLDKHPDNRPTLAEIRAGFAGLVSAGLVTLDPNRQHTYGSGLNSRIQTPSRGLPTPPAGMPAIGTQPPSAAAAFMAPTSPPVAGEVMPIAKKKRGGLLIAGIAGVVVVGGVVAFVVLQGGGETPAKQQPAVAAAPAAAPVPPPTPVEKTVAKPAAPEPSFLDISVKPEDAQIMIDGAAHAPGKAKVDAGRHTVAVTAEGYKHYEVPWAVEAGQTTQVAVTLEKETVAAKGSTPVKKPPAGPTKPPTGATKPPAGKGSATKHDTDGTMDVDFGK